MPGYPLITASLSVPGSRELEEFVALSRKYRYLVRVKQSMEDGGGMSCAAAITADILELRDYVRLLDAVKC